MKNTISYRPFGQLLLPALLICMLSACTTNKRLAYFQNLQDTSFHLTTKNFEPLIQNGDIIYVGVTSSDPVSAAMFNTANAIIVQNGFNAMPVNATPGMLVSGDGRINLPKIGAVAAIGKTTRQLGAEIKEALLPYLKDPVVTVRFMNYKITVLGEVARPATITVPNERVSILEALGLAGDLTPFGNRKNVLVIRDSAGVQDVHRLNLQDNSVFKSPFFYLRPNDVVYVEPNNTRGLQSTNAPILLPSIISGLSLLVVLVTQLSK